jgi:hypothetical protein
MVLLGTGIIKTVTAARKETTIKKGNKDRQSIQSSRRNNFDCMLTRVYLTMQLRQIHNKLKASSP